MKQFSISHRWSFLLGALLVFPIVFVITSALLKYGLGINQPFDAAQPLLEKWGIKERFGWNINAVILFGPILAILLNLFSLVKFNFKAADDYYEIFFFVKSYWWNIILVLVACAMLGILFLYMIGENCR